MKPLNIAQKKALSDLCVNLATAWLTAGAIAPWFNRSSINQKMFVDLTVTIVMGFSFMYISYRVLK